MTTGEKIQNLRQQKGWSQERLGQELNLSRQSISKWESGTANPTVENLKELAKIFDVSVDSLLGNEINIQDKEPKEDNTKDNTNDKKDKIIKILPIALTGVLAVISAGLIISQINIYKQLERLQNSIAVIPNTVYVNSNNGGESNTSVSLFTSWDITAKKYYQNRTMDILISVLPKNDVEGTKVEFSITGDEQQVITAEKEGQSYNAVVNVPWGAEPTINASIIKPDGTIENEILPIYGVTSQDLFSVSLMTSYESGWSNKIYAYLDFENTYAPKYDSENTTMAIISGNPTLVEWEVKEAGKIIEKDSRKIDNDENVSYQQVSIISQGAPLKVKNIKEVSIVVNITDENGIVTTLSENLK